MKTRMKILIAASLILIVTGCKEKDSPITIVDPSAPTYRILNRSGHTVSIVHDPVCYELPDSLGLSDGKEFILHTNGDYFGELPMGIELIEFDKQVIYYDGRYVMNLGNLPKERRLQDLNCYQRRPDTHSIYEFTLTSEDYDYAVAHGTDLGPIK